MQRLRKQLALLIVFALMATCDSCPAAGGPAACSNWIARIVSIEGNVQVRSAGEGPWRTAELNHHLMLNDMIRVREYSRAALQLCNESVLRLDAGTTLTLTGVEEGRTTLLDLLSGAVHFFSRKAKSLKFFTPFINGSVEGTEFVVEVSANHALVTLFQGRVSAANDHGRIDLVSGQSAVAEQGRAPAYRMLLMPRDAVQWAVYTPLIVTPQADSWARFVDSGWKSAALEAARCYRSGNPAGALRALMGVPATGGGARFFTERAGLLLSVGRIDEARQDIQQALALAPEDGYALSLKSIDALGANRRDSALEIAERAVAVDPASVPAKIALSYAKQAHYDLPGALAVMEDAVRRDPPDALAWARLAELQQMAGDLAASLSAAKRAAELQPDLALVQTVLGFSYLTRIELDEALNAFEKAIRLDQGNPLPRLGLGLAKIRRGHLAQGRGDIEIAASLDPNNSLIRSYLGKAYYEEKRDPLAESQLAEAKKLDPLDPTPWFYDAIRKQTINRPVEALRDLQKSIELNDNRAVYRSRLLLDEDLAARSASLGRIYSDLGFQQLALVEGWKSLDADPSNFSAHRFLADSYAALPRHEIARVSELLQSQLLQPININPVGPNLAESSLEIFQGTGPPQPSFNEYTPLFNSNRAALQLSGVAGENSTLGDEAVLSGVWNKMSFSVGQLHQQTNGVRDNNDLNENIYNAFVQISLTPNASIQAEVRSKDLDAGDRLLLFDPDRFSANEKNKRGVDSYRFGGRYRLGPGSDLVASFIKQNGDVRAWDQDTVAVETFEANYSYDIKEDSDGYNLELQHLLRSGRLNLVSGVGYATSDFKRVSKVVVEFPDFGIVDRRPAVVEKAEPHTTNAYIYSHFPVLDQLSLTGGVSYDDFDNDAYSRNQFNPKLGLAWSPFSGTTARGAVFRALTRTLATDQTVEPTQVAGFNQFYDLDPGTDVWTYAAAVDQRFTEEVFGGAEFTWRDLDVPYSILKADGAEHNRSDWEERNARAYLYWAPHPWVVGSAEYGYEDWDREGRTGGVEHIRELKTHRLGLGGAFFHPSGFFTRLKATYVDQNGEFWNVGMTATTDEGDRFWVVDGAIGYRLPKRYGVVSLEIKNLFDQGIRFQDTDPANPSIYPERLALIRCVLSF